MLISSSDGNKEKLLESIATVRGSGNAGRLLGYHGYRVWGQEQFYTTSKINTILTAAAAANQPAALSVIGQSEENKAASVGTIAGARQGEQSKVESLYYDSQLNPGRAYRNEPNNPSEVNAATSSSLIRPLFVKDAHWNWQFKPASFDTTNGIGYPIFGTLQMI